MTAMRKCCNIRDDVLESMPIIPSPTVDVRQKLSIRKKRSVLVYNCDFRRH
jgi:hypothetical protein